MTINSITKQFLDMLRAGPPITSLSPVEARAAIDAMLGLRSEPEAVSKIEEQTISVDNGEINVRIYTPEGTGPFPLFVSYHGGGYVIGNLEFVDHGCRSIANAGNCVVVSAEYRKSPEYKFPIPVEDCYKALEWVHANAAQLNGDASKIIVGGDSAGGNLSAVMTQLTKDRQGPSIAAQVLLYPGSDLNLGYQSVLEYGEGYGLDVELINWFVDHYLNHPSERDHKYASSIMAEEFNNLPQALVITAELDPIRDQGKAYADRLQEAGVPVQHICMEGHIHGYFSYPPFAESMKNTAKEIGLFLNNALATSV
jgi:acetyl esterase